MRKNNTDRLGSYFSEEVKAFVWSKGYVIQGQLPSVVRKDRCGAVIRWADYGATFENGVGWEIDHIVPLAHGGNDNLSNLQPLQWQNNRNKGDSLQPTYCLVSAI